MVVWVWVVSGTCTKGVGMVCLCTSRDRDECVRFPVGVRDIASGDRESLAMGVMLHGEHSALHSMVIEVASAYIGREGAKTEWDWKGPD